MPFVDGATLKQYQYSTEVKQLFVGRGREIHYFIHAILKPKNPEHNIVAIYGQAGIGKSYLLVRLIEEACASNFKDYCKTAMVDERQPTPINIMECFAGQLRVEGKFVKSLERYKEALRQARNEQETANENMLRKAAGFASSTIKNLPLPGIGQLAGEGAELLGEYALDQWHYRRINENIKALENPLEDVTKSFIDELNKLAETQVTLPLDQAKRARRIILFFDAFEHLSQETTSWLLDSFLEKRISRNVVLVIASREFLGRSHLNNSKRWLHYLGSHIIQQFSLDSFTREETKQYFYEQGMTNMTEITARWRFSQGLPLSLGLLASSKGNIVDPTSTVIANFLDLIPQEEPIKRKLALDAALFSCPFTQDDLAAFSYIAETERPNLYHWLSTQSFINSQDGRHSYHELARELFSQHLYQCSPGEYRATRRRLGHHYEAQIQSIKQEKNSDISTWLELQLGLVEQLISLSDESEAANAVEHVMFVLQYIIEYPQRVPSIARILKKLAYKDPDVQEDVRTQQTAKLLLHYIETEGGASAVSSTQEELSTEIIHLDLARPLASLYRGRGFIRSKMGNYQEALIDYDLAIKLNSLDASIYNQRGNVYFALKEYRKAIADYDRAIMFNSQEAFFYLNRSFTYFAIGDLQKALGDCEIAIQLEPSNGYCYDQRGSIFLALQDFQKALDDYTQVITLEPFRSNHYLNRAFVYTQLEKYQEALQDYNCCIQLDSSNATLYCNRALVWVKLKQYTEAFDDCNQAIQLAPDEGSYYALRGAIHFTVQEFQKALTDYNVALESNPGQIYYLCAMIYAQMREYQKALEKIDLSIISDPSNDHLYSFRACVYFFLNNLQNSLEDCNFAIKLHSTNAVYYNQRGNVYLRLKKYQQALIDYNYAIQLEPSGALGYSHRALIYVKLKRYQEGLEDCNTAIQFDPTNADSYNQRGNVYFYLREYNRSLEDYNHAISINSTNEAFYSNRARVYEKLNEFQKALDNYKQAAKINPNEDNFFNCALACFHLKHYQVAFIHFLEALKLSLRSMVSVRLLIRLCSFLWR